MASLDLPLRAGVAPLPAGVKAGRAGAVALPFAPVGATVRVAPRAVVDGVLYGEPINSTGGSVVIEPGPHAVAPRCKYYGGACGGCAFQSTSDAAQGAAKAAWVARCMATALPSSHADALAAATLPLWHAVPAYGYRNRAEMTVAGATGELGFFPYRPPPARWQPTVTPVDECHLLPPPVSAAFRAVRRALASLGSEATVAHVTAVAVRAAAAGELMVTVRATNADTAFDALSHDTFTAPLRSGLEAEGIDAAAVSLVLSHHPTSIPRATVRALRDACATAAPTPAGRADALLAAKAAYLAGVQRVVFGPGVLTTRTSLPLASALPPPLASLWTALTGTPPSAAPLRDATLTARVSPLAFAQPSDAGAAAIAAAVATAVAGVLPAASAARAEGGAVAWDMFCGGGALGLAAVATHAVSRVVGIDINPAAVADAAAAADANGVPRTAASYLCADLLGSAVVSTPRGVAIGAAHLPRPHVVILDPPRPGVGPRMLAALRDLAPPAIVYVSCNPASLAADVGTLVRDCAYTVAALLPVDQFPHTPHVEAIAVLRKATP